MEIIEGSWEYPSAGDDIAAGELPLRSHFHYKPIDIGFLVTKDMARDLRIGLGDDLFMVGRFINHDGKERNIPVVRFGTIAMMPDEPIMDDGHPQESFLIEIRTIPGYSGSPVLVHIPDTRLKDQRVKPTDQDLKYFKQHGCLEKCLGIEWRRVKGDTVATPSINGSTFDIQLTSGMFGCIPAWKIADLLRTNEKFVMQRREGDKRMR
jgi:hypothetical protein